MILLILDDPYYKQNMLLIFFQTTYTFQNCLSVENNLYINTGNYGTFFSYPKALTLENCVAIPRKQRQEKAAIRK